MSVAFIILNWKNAEASIRCASALLNNDISGRSIYIVDNNSLDGSVQKFHEKLNACRILQNNLNTGYTGGNNLGLRTAFSDGFDSALILNNDVIPYIGKTFDADIKKILTTNPNTLVGIHVYTVNGHLTFPSSAGKYIRILFKLSQISDQTLLICGCAMLISRDTYMLIGGLDESYFMYCEEIDLTMRVLASGGRVDCPVELGYVLRDDLEERRPYVYYYQARNLFFLSLKYSQSKKYILAIASALVSIKQAIYSRKFINIYMTLYGLIDAIKGRVGRNPTVHN